MMTLHTKSAANLKSSSVAGRNKEAPRKHKKLSAAAVVSPHNQDETERKKGTGSNSSSSVLTLPRIPSAMSLQSPSVETSNSKKTSQKPISGKRPSEPSSRSAAARSQSNQITSRSITTSRSAASKHSTNRMIFRNDGGDDSGEDDEEKKCTNCKPTYNEELHSSDDSDVEDKEMSDKGDESASPGTSAAKTEAKLSQKSQQSEKAKTSSNAHDESSDALSLLDQLSKAEEESHLGQERYSTLHTKLQKQRRSTKNLVKGYSEIQTSIAEVEKFMEDPEAIDSLYRELRSKNANGEMADSTEE